MGGWSSLLDLINVLAQMLGMPPEVLAFLAGVVLTAIVARLAFLFGTWRKAARAPNEPQQAYTTRTPSQVVGEARAARLKLTCLVVGLGLAACALATSAAGPAALGEALQSLQRLLSP